MRSIASGCATRRACSAPTRPCLASSSRRCRPKTSSRAVCSASAPRRRPMSIEALIFDVDGTMADTEEAHRVAFNLAFERQRLGWTWTRSEYRELLSVTGGKERIASYIDSLPVSAALRQRLIARVPEIHADKTKFYSSAVRDGGVPLRDGVA